MRSFKFFILVLLIFSSIFINGCSFEEEDNPNIVDKIPPSKKFLSDCVYNFDLSINTVIFYHSDDSYSDNMVPIVEKLEKDYDFFWQDDLWDNKFNSCFDLSGNVPAFICAGSKEVIVGEFTLRELSDFAASCKT